MSKGTSACASRYTTHGYTFVRPMTELQRDELCYDLRNRTGYPANQRSKYGGPVLKERIERCEWNA